MKPSAGHAGHGNGAIDNDFSLARGGPTYRVARAIGRWLPGLRPGWLMVTLLLLATFAPMAGLAWHDGTLLPGKVAIPLLGDWFVLARFLVALPLLVLTIRSADLALGGTLRQFVDSGAIPQHARPELHRARDAVYRARDAFWPELACLLLAFVPTFMPALTTELIHSHLPQMTTWRYTDAGVASAAGTWLTYIAAPAFRFLLLIWLWRLLLWTWLLWRFSRMDFDLHATHPDHACGLGFLGTAQTRFAPLSAAGAIVMCGNCANQMIHAGQSIGSLRFLIGGYAVGATVLLLAPLLLLVPALRHAKLSDLTEFGIFGGRLARAFDERCKRDGATNDPSKLLENPAPSTLADFGGVYANIADTSFMPATRWDLLQLALAALVPFLPLAFIAMPLNELVKRILTLLM